MSECTSVQVVLVVQWDMEEMGEKNNYENGRRRTASVLRGGGIVTRMMRDREDMCEYNHSKRANV